jgi:hypothetical protein
VLRFFVGLRFALWPARRFLPPLPADWFTWSANWLDGHSHNS